MSIISASILSCSQAYIGRDVTQAINAGAKTIHVDIMDGYYVRNMTFGPGLIRDLAEITNAPICVHLEVEKPELIAPLFFDTPCHSIVFQIDASNNPICLLRQIKSAGKRAGVGLGPAYGIENVRHIMHHLDEIIIMSVEPGYAGQPFESSVYEKLVDFRRLANDAGVSVEVSVDGGVAVSNARKLKESGADVLICGSSVFNGDISKNVQQLLLSLENSPM